jgi:hypothetical protein
MQKTIDFLNKLEIWFFYGFLITFTLSIRKVMFFYPLRSQFNEYAGIYIYLSDIFLILVLISGGFSILYNIIINKSRYVIYLKLYLKQKVIIIPLLLVILSFISAIWSTNSTIAIFRSIKLLEFYLLYLWFIFKIVPRGTIFYKNIFKILIFTGVIQSIVGIWQFVIQRSLSLPWLKESIISPDISGIAKIVLNGGKYIRAYGLFPHPNILGGFLVLSIVLTILYIKMFNSSNNVPRGTFYGTGAEQFSCFRRGALLKLAIFIQSIALILTFSKSSWLGLTLALLYIWVKNVPRGTIFKSVLEYLKYFALIGGIVILLILILKPSEYSFIGKSLEDRVFYLNVSRGTFFDDPILGVGTGQFVISSEKMKDIQDWQFQPVHNVFLLILNEWGIIGFILFIWFIWEIHKIVSRGTLQVYIKSIFFGFLFIMLVDHYFWDIQQGQIMFWMILGLMTGGKMCINKESNTCPQVEHE